MLEKCGENVCMEAVEAWESNDVEKVWRILCADKKKAFVLGEQMASRTWE